MRSLTNRGGRNPRAASVLRHVRHVVAGVVDLGVLGAVLGGEPALPLLLDLGDLLLRRLHLAEDLARVGAAGAALLLVVGIELLELLDRRQLAIGVVDLGVLGAVLGIEPTLPFGLDLLDLGL